MTATGTFEIWNAALTERLAVIPELRASNPPRVQDVPNDTGIIEVALGLDEAAAEHVVENNHLRALIGDEIVMTAVIEAPIKRHHIAVTGPVAQIVELSCRGRAIVLDDAPIDPPGGITAKPASTQRPMSWASPECDLTAAGWQDAAVIYERMSVPFYDPVTGYDPPFFEPWLLPVGWYDPTASLIWCRNLVDGGHPPGDGLFATDIDIPEPGLYLLQYIGDDYVEPYVQGLLVDKGTEYPGDTFIAARQATYELTAGTIRVGLRGRNYDRPVTEQVGTFGAPNKGYVAMAIFRMPQGANSIPTAADLIAHTDGTWRSWDLLANPDPPAPTWGKRLLTVIDEGKAAGTVPANLTPTFTETTTTAGTPWANTGASIIDLDNDTILSVLRAGVTDGCIEWRNTPDGLGIDAANPGELGDTFDVDHTPDGGGLTDLQEATL